MLLHQRIILKYNKKTKKKERTYIIKKNGKLKRNKYDSQKMT